MILKFESREAPDPEVKAALEWLLPVTDRGGFRSRVLARLWGLGPPFGSVTTLERWARPALAAAATIALLAWVAGGMLESPLAAADTLTLDGAMVSSATGSTPAAFVIAAPRPPDSEAMIAALVTP